MLSFKVTKLWGISTGFVRHFSVDLHVRTEEMGAVGSSIRNDTAPASSAALTMVLKTAIFDFQLFASPTETAR